MIDSSVIIPTYNRSQSLARTLESLSAQSLPFDRFEVIIVDDGSTDATPQVAAGEYPYPVVYQRQKNQGSAAARNLGAQISRGWMLAYIDDDILVEPTFLETLVSAHHKYERAVIQGSLVVQPPQDPTSSQLAFAQIYSTPVLPPGEVRPLKFDACVTCSFSVKREHFFQLGALQDVGGDGRTAWGDVDFGYRAVQSGFELVMVGGALSYHCDASMHDLWSFLRRWEHTSEMAVTLFDRYPEMEGQIEMYKDKGPVAWGKDSPGAALNKLVHGIAASPAVTWSLPFIVKAAERITSDPEKLKPIYRTILGVYLTRGYRRGLAERISPGPSLPPVEPAQS